MHSQNSEAEVKQINQITIQQTNWFNHVSLTTPIKPLGLGVSTI